MRYLSRIKKLISKIFSKLVKEKVKILVKRRLDELECLNISPALYYNISKYLERRVCTVQKDGKLYIFKSKDSDLQDIIEIISHYNPENDNREEAYTEYMQCYVLSRFEWKSRQKEYFDNLYRQYQGE